MGPSIEESLRGDRRRRSWRLRLYSGRAATRSRSSLDGADPLPSPRSTAHRRLREPGPSGAGWVGLAYGVDPEHACTRHRYSRLACQRGPRPGGEGSRTLSSGSVEPGTWPSARPGQVAAPLVQPEPAHDRRCGSPEATPRRSGPSRRAASHAPHRLPARRSATRGASPRGHDAVQRTEVERRRMHGMPASPAFVTRRKRKW